MKLIRSTRSKIATNENGGNVPYSKITEVVLVHCNIVNNNYQQNSTILYAFVSNESFGWLLLLLPKNVELLKTFDSEFSYSEVWVTDQNYLH